jgi:hypothetical protein
VAEHNHKEIPMCRPVVTFVVAVLLLAACAAPRQPAPSMQLRACDDGGEGGVIIDGVCL